MTHEEHHDLVDIVTKEPFKIRPRLLKFLETVQIQEIEKIRGTRTSQQNKALWKFFSLVADKLTELGVSMRTIFKETDTFDMPPTKDSVHDLWVHFQKAMVNTERTRDLKKDQIDRIHEVFMKNMGEKFHLEYIDFPHDDERLAENIAPMKRTVEYEDSYEEPLV